MPTVTTPQGTSFVELAGHRLPVVPQKHARLRHKMNIGDFQKIMSRDYSHESYRILGILIPALHDTDYGMTEWEFDGFTTEDAWRAYHGTEEVSGDPSRYDEENDTSPTTAEIVAAFETALMVSGAGRLGKLLTLISSTTEAAQVSQTELSPASPGPTGVSPSTASGTTAPMSNGNME